MDDDNNGAAVARCRPKEPYGVGDSVRNREREGVEKLRLLTAVKMAVTARHGRLEAAEIGGEAR